MDDPNSVAALDLLKRGIADVDSATPKGPRELPVLEAMPVKMTWQLVARCEAIHHLLADGLLDEATLILRTLLWDSQRLMYMDQHPEWRKALILGMEEEQLKKWEQLGKQAAKRDRDPEAIIKHVRNRRKQLQELGLPVGRHRKFPEGSGMANELGRESDLIGHLMYSHAAHSAAWSQTVNIQKSDAGGLQHFLRNKSPRLIVAVAGCAIEYLFKGTIATAKAQEWDTLDELRQQYEQISGKLEGLHDQCERVGNSEPT